MFIAMLQKTKRSLVTLIFERGIVQTVFWEKIVKHKAVQLHSTPTIQFFHYFCCTFNFKDLLIRTVRLYFKFKYIFVRKYPQTNLFTNVHISQRQMTRKDPLIGLQLL